MAILARRVISDRRVIFPIASNNCRVPRQATWLAGRGRGILRLPDFKSWHELACGMVMRMCMDEMLLIDLISSAVSQMRTRLRCMKNTNIINDNISNPMQCRGLIWRRGRGHVLSPLPWAIMTPEDYDYRVYLQTRTIYISRNKYWHSLCTLALAGIIAIVNP